MNRTTKITIASILTFATIALCFYAVSAGGVPEGVQEFYNDCGYVCYVWPGGSGDCYPCALCTTAVVTDKPKDTPVPPPVDTPLPPDEYSVVSNCDGWKVFHDGMFLDEGTWQDRTTDESFWWKNDPYRDFMNIWIAEPQDCNGPPPTEEPTLPPPPTEEPTPDPTEEPHGGCNRGRGNGPENCDPGNSYGQGNGQGRQAGEDRNENKKDK